MAKRNKRLEDEMKQIIEKRGGNATNFDLVTANKNALEDCMEYIADELCDEGINDDGEINQYGEHMETLIDYLLHHKFEMEQENAYLMERRERK